MRKGPKIPPIISVPRDTTASDALLHNIFDVLKENNAYQLAALEQQNQLHDSLNDLNRSLLANRERQHAGVEEVSLQVDGLREDLNRLFTESFRGAQRTTTGMGRRSSRRPRRVQTPRPRRSSPDLTDSSGSSDEDSLEPDVDPDRRYRYSEPAVPIRRSYTPAPTHPGIPSVTTRTTLGQTRTPTPFRHLRPGSRQRSSQGSSGLTYVTDNPVIPFLPPGFIPSPGQDPAAHRQNPFPTPCVPFQQSPLHLAPVPPPPQMHHYRDRASSNGQSN